MTSWCAELLLTLLCLVGGRSSSGCRSLLSAGLLPLVAIFWLVPFASGHAPLPDSVLNPQSAPEAWNVLRLAGANIERLLREDRLGEVPDQASLCSPALRLLARQADATPRRKDVAIGTVRASSAVDALAQGCVAGDRPSVALALAKLHAALDALAAGVDPQVVNADIFFCAMHPDIVSADGKAFCPKCGMPLTPRRIPYSFVYVAPPGEPSMRLTAVSDMPPEAGRPTHVKVRLTTRDGTPVGLSDLLLAHTQRIHLLIVDPALEDYHHEHPTPTGVSGEYEFTFTPALTTTYRIYADVVPEASGVQEFVPADLPGAAKAEKREQPPAQHPNTFEAAAGGLRFRLVTESSAGGVLRVGHTCALGVFVNDDHGQPFARLEPVMNAFAHLVGFCEDGRTVLHLHPAGAEVTDIAARGGPFLEFRFYAPKEGFLRLYCQVCVDGKMLFVPFDVNVIK